MGKQVGASNGTNGLRQIGEPMDGLAWFYALGRPQRAKINTVREAVHLHFLFVYVSCPKHNGKYNAAPHMIGWARLGGPPEMNAGVRVGGTFGWSCGRGYACWGIPKGYDVHADQEAR